MWLSSLFGNIALMRSFRLGGIILCGLILTNCGDVTIRQLGTENLQNLQQIAVQDASGREGQLYGRELRKLLHIGGKGAENYDLISSISVSAVKHIISSGRKLDIEKNEHDRQF